MFLQADAALRSGIGRITPAQLALPVPAEWSRAANPTLRDILAAHAEDEAWLPAVLEGRTIEEVGDTYQGDLLGDDLVENLWEQIAPDIEMWRGFGVFPPDVPVPEGANREVQLLGKAGYWRT